VSTVQELGWAGLQNGALLRQAATDGFAVFLTMDRNIEHQQDIAVLGLAIVARRARSNDIIDLLPLMPEVLALLPSLMPGQFIRVPESAR
jgi:hypothetical protein